MSWLQRFGLWLATRGDNAFPLYSVLDVGAGSRQPDTEDISLFAYRAAARCLELQDKHGKNFVVVEYRAVQRWNPGDVP